MALSPKLVLVTVIFCLAVLLAVDGAVAERRNAADLRTLASALLADWQDLERIQRKVDRSLFRFAPKTVREAELYRGRLPLPALAPDRWQDTQSPTPDRRTLYGRAIAPPEFLRLARADSASLRALKTRCGRFFAEVREAALIFRVPERILFGLIYRESGCVPSIRNPNSSALGLNQFVDKTWRWVRGELKRDTGMDIKDRVDPRSSLMAGGWYLNHLFQFVQRRNPQRRLRRERIEDWDLALQYYYAGEGCGPKPGCHPEKRPYAARIIAWASQMT